MNIFVNHIGYEPGDRKKAVIEGPAEMENLSFSLIDRKSGSTVWEGRPQQAGAVDQWKDWNFLELDFSEIKTPGQYFLIVMHEGKVITSETFEIRDNLMPDKTISDILFYFKSMRSSGNYDKRDRKAPVFGSHKSIDVSGGWYDASGDTSKYLSHLSYANYLNPQQIPMVGWNMLDALEDLKKRNRLHGEETEKRFVEEILQGADFVMRMQDEKGFFYMILFDQWSKDLEKRMLCSYSGQDGKRWTSYEAAYRQGGGMAIALLARTASLSLEGDFTASQYRDAAIKGFDHLEENNLKYLDDGKENIIDDYCALMAASELYNLTGDSRYSQAAERRAQNLVERVRMDGPYKGWLSADGADRPYFHAAEAGLPVLSLVRFLEVQKVEESPLIDDVLTAILRIVSFELDITGEVNNPFGYARQYTKADNREAEGSFFVPHVNPSGYWWQGENARLASLAAAAVKSSRLFQSEEGLSESLRDYALDQLSWIVGCNPYNMSMLQGHGANNPVYEKDYGNNPGGIANGITSGFYNENDIDFAPEGIGSLGDHSWRWGEQWIPHAGWFLLAVALL